ncbi:hypothetical protein IX317_000620 [Fusobacterium sp. DD29]|uniref:hypothetical protein n=1 Tax=unclassified Fusobacterium TaxID=2648384 RepID=UPI001B8D140A|nr:MULTISPECIES: hypothetical protein [unclassified Fusobacterium]MBR8700258.1 hypothetical protein [Fusobacterium sp. DD45]MBR8710487.1 hypothetical protein [Fusobacterium sp. DD28]MBR8748959.1 hypothetical protein [Fusobacterium sp. DD29]MBR8751063.1 hypothetical protein [Fusobacterium sp. DD26]MBR8761265.1 hypothetical protein [Fusobacterium sp. DD25]
MESKILNKSELKKLYTLVDIAENRKAVDTVRAAGNIVLGYKGMYTSDGYRLAWYHGFYFDTDISIHYRIVKAIKVINPEWIKITVDKDITIELMKENSIFTTIKTSIDCPVLKLD